MISWEEYVSDDNRKSSSANDPLSSSTLHYLFVDGKGKSLSKEFTTAAPISDCQPVVKDSKVVYYASNSNTLNFYSINSDNGKADKKTYHIAGDNATWNFKNGILTISGYGPLSISTEENNRYPVSSTNGWFSFSSDSSWKAIKNQIRKVIIKPGITSISERAFVYLPELKEVDIQKGVTKIGKEAYIENAYVLGNSEIGEGTVLSHVRIMDRKIPEQIVLHGLELPEGKKVIRIYGVADNPKGKYPQEVHFLGTTLNQFMEINGVSKEDLWDDAKTYLWFAKLYPVCADREEALDMADIIYKMAQGMASREEVEKWCASERMSLYSSFNAADIEASSELERFLENRVLAKRFIWNLEQGMYYEDALKIFGKRGISQEIFQLLMKDAANSEFSLKIRIYHAISRYMKSTRTIYDELHYDAIESDCFGTIQNVIYAEAEKNLPDSARYKIAKDQVEIALPVRVNWGGGWTDTPPHCNEKGGVVLNAAMKLRGIYPVQITVKKLAELHVEFESKDIGVYTTVNSVALIQDCHNPYDSFALHKAALIACGIIPVKEEADLQEILKRLGGGIYLSTQVYGVPKGSGLGTSSILSGACVKGIFEFLGLDRTDAEIYDVVLGMEQIMSTGGGWQDQVGGLTEGIKLISTKPGIAQNLVVEKIEMSEEGKKELKERFALIYTGQRRLARNLLRDVVGGYIGSRPESLKALKEMKAVAVLMRFALEQGDIDEFAELLNQHWELSCMLDAGTTNTCIDQILLVCEDLVDGKFISGAGGGGFIQVILKKGVTKEQLHERLHGVFQDSGVDVWDCELLL